MAYIRQTGTPVEPVLSDDLLEFLKLPSSFGDQAVLVAAARQTGETLTGRALALRSFQQVLERFPCGAIRLFYPPLVSVESVKYLDASGDEQTIPSGDYMVDDVDQPARIALKPGKNWPAPGCFPSCVRIAFTAGYIRAANDDYPTAQVIPEVLKLGILNLAAFWFQSRGMTAITAATGEGFKVPPYIEKIFTTQAVSDFLPIEF
jgi:uncharacterized phiE125 gp8 family phage protein